MSGVFDTLGGLFDVGTSLWNTYNQYQVQKQNRADQKSVNAQNQYNLENSYSIAAADLRNAGLSRTLLSGGATGTSQVAYNSSAAQLKDGVLSDALINLAQLKKLKSDVKVQEQNADTARMNAETEQQRANTEATAVANSDQNQKASLNLRNKEYIESVRQFDVNQERLKKEFESGQTYKYDALKQEKDNFLTSFNQSVSEFEAQFAQRKYEFLETLKENKREFDSSLEEQIAARAFKEALQRESLDFDMDKFLTELSQDKEIADNKNAVSMMDAVLSSVGKILSILVFKYF